MAGRVWIDVEDLFEYAVGNPRPSGIQRLAFELYTALQARPDAADRVGFLRHARRQNQFVVVGWDEVTALFEGLTVAAPARPTAVPAPVAAASSVGRARLRRASRLLPEDLRQPLMRMVRGQAAVAREAGGLLLALLRRGGGRAPARALRSAQGAAFAEHAKPGDILAALGAPWSNPDYPAMVAEACARHDLRFMLLVYDIIPLVRPEWCDADLVRSFRAWFEGVLPLADRLLAISQATAADVIRHAERRGIALRDQPRVVPIGTGFGPDVALVAPLSDRLPPAGSYALIVSTIEVRKNHLLLLRVWRRLLDEMPADEVPVLVFAGRVGWLVTDLMQQLEKSGYLGGKIMLVEQPDDGELAALYRGCLFTLFPSFYEGWGLPVGESLAFGKPCIVSNTTSVPEVGGDLARYIDPDNVTGATAVIRATLQDRAGLAEWAARIGRDYRPPAWADTADAVLAAVDA